MSELIQKFLAFIQAVDKLPFDAERDAKKVAYWHKRRLLLMYDPQEGDKLFFKVRPNRIGAPFPCQKTDHQWQGIVERDSRWGHSSPTTRIRAGILQ